MKIREITEGVGRITKQNQTVDVGPNQVSIEAFNNPYPINWFEKTQEVWEGSVQLPDGSKLFIDITDDDGEGYYNIEFSKSDTQGKGATMKATGTGDEFRIFATVQAGILEWWNSVDEDDVQKITFNASKQADDSKNRYKLYARFAKQWASKIGWVATSREEDGGISFVLMRPAAAKYAKDQDLEVMEELVTELVTGTNANKEHLINRANKVADICATMGDKPLLYRQVRNTGMYGDKALIIKATPRGIRDEKLLGSGNDVQPHVLNKLGIEHPVFSTMDPHPGTQGKFGANYFMVPIDSYKIYSSPQVNDLGSDTSYNDKDRKMFAPPSDEEVAKFDAVADTYKEGWPSAGFPNEVILDCEQYYMINVGEFVKKYAGEKARQMYTRDPDKFSKIKNDINKELLTSRFKTYNDMAWYLRNPVRNLLTTTRIKEGVGRITKQNQTVDVGPNQVSIEAKKMGFTVDKDGRPPTLSTKG